MGQTFDSFLNSRAGTALGLGISQIRPRIGYPIARWLARRVAAMKGNPMVKAARANQWVIHDEQPTASELDALVAAMYQSAAYSLYDFWHFSRDPQAVAQKVILHPSFIECFDRARADKTGLILVGPHQGNFDMMGRAIALSGRPIHALSYPQPGKAYQLQNSLRAVPNLTLTPLSMASLRQASETLRGGGAVITGVDRPLPEPDGKYKPAFFGRPAIMPVFHIRLALKHRLPVVVISNQRQPDGRYLVSVSDPIPMRPHPDLVTETVINAEAVLKVIEGYINNAKDQWAMYYPVWPESLERMPR